MRYFTQSISTDGGTFITVKHDDNDGGFEWQLNKSMTKEFFRKLKKADDKKRKVISL